jgi:hypothetical protein
MLANCSGSVEHRAAQTPRDAEPLPAATLQRPRAEVELQGQVGACVIFPLKRHQKGHRIAFFCHCSKAATDMYTMGALSSMQPYLPRQLAEGPPLRCVAQDWWPVPSKAPQAG